MNRSRIIRLAVYTILIFLGGIFSAGLYMTLNGYEVPWAIGQKALASPQVAQEAILSGTEQSPVGTSIIENIVDQAGPAVVKIETYTQTRSRSNDFFFNDPFFREFFGDSFNLQPRDQVQKGLGSGFIISKDGYILTNNHVVEGASQIKVYLTSRDEPYDAKLVGSDAELDLAVLKISAGSNLPVLTLGDSNQVRVGSWVIAIGNPYGLDHTVTVGVISAKGRPIQIGNTEFKDMMQTDASINPGNSGGPLLNLKGEVVGINTAINAQAQGIGFAIPSSTVKQVLDQLLENGKVSRPYLGIYMQPVTEDLARYFGLNKVEGVLISAVNTGSPAEKAGLRRGDIVLEYNGKPVNSPEELSEAVKNSKIGDKVTLLVFRNKATQYVSVTIAER